MFPSPAMCRRRGSFAAMVALLGVLGIVTVSVPAVAAPALTYTRNEPAIAMVSASTVYLEVTYTGMLRDTKTGQPRTPAPVTVLRRCSGVVVDPQGDVLTTTLCVQPGDDIILVNALYRHGRDLVTQGTLAPDKLDGFVESIQAASSFTGEKAGAPPAVRVLGQIDIATPELATTPAIPGTIQSVLPANAGNAALVRLQRPGLPVIELGPGDDPTPGDSVVAVGYGPASSDLVAGSYTIKAKTLTVTDRTATNRFGLSGELGPDARGGAVVNTDGRLIALLDADPNVQDDPTSDLITMLHLQKLLAQAGVTNQLSDVDRAFRDALAAYFAGKFALAVGKFDAVLKSDPTHVYAGVYRDRAAKRLSLDGDSVENQGAWLQYVLYLAAGAALVLLLERGGRRLLPKRKPAPQPVPQPAPDARPAEADATVVLRRVDMDQTVVLPAGTETVVLPAVTGGDETVVLSRRNFQDRAPNRQQPGMPLGDREDARG
ncbi:serine protease [Dactylosporangium sp. AC04546]|uniref:S1 family peptidase n=1 Tax=Dactylosporangium sp. AC04546 TaxID=2862460 RepID=UPI001EE004E2|nr:serine protease [Dactylosporangium sp. AC04546]WVK81427.1 serine protease [Dactylosporangium sp. AC04546]